MVTDWILLISEVKLSNRIGLPLFFYFCFSSCSQTPHQMRPVQAHKTASEKKKETVSSSGPSQPQNQKFFVDKTADWGLQGEKAVHLYAVDFNSDGHQDLVLLPDYYAVPKFLAYDLKSKKFVAVPSLFTTPIMASFLSFHDFNKDGIPDVLVAVLNQKTELSKYPLRLFLGHKEDKKISYREKKGAFPVNKDPTSTVAVFDFDMDGQLDIYAGNWFDYSQKVIRSAPDRLYRGDKGKFQDYSSLLLGERQYSNSFNTYLQAAPTAGAAACDIDQNGHIDVLVANFSGLPNKMWLNLSAHDRSGRRFENKAKEAEFAHDKEGINDRRGGGHTFYALCTDYNNDGAIDVAVGELFHSYDPETVDRSSILTGSRYGLPRFLRTEYHQDDGTYSWSQGDRRASWIDYNFDGLVDLIVDNNGFPPKSRFILFHQEDDHAFKDLALQYGIDFVNPSGTVVLDVDRDGRLDIIAGQTKLRDQNIMQRIYAFHNQVPFEGRRVLTIKLRGKKASAYGEGATLILKTSQNTYHRINTFSYGYLNSQNEDGVVFGLKKGERPLNVRVRWSMLTQDRKKRPHPLAITYSLKYLKMRRATTLYLCDDRNIPSRRPCF